MFNPLNSLVCSCITPCSNLIRLALYFKKINLSALTGSSRARCSVMTPPAVLKRRSEGTKRTEHYPAEISGTGYRFGRNRSRNRIRKNGRISGQPEPDIRYIPSLNCASRNFLTFLALLTIDDDQDVLKLRLSHLSHHIFSTAVDILNSEYFEAYALYSMC